MEDLIFSKHYVDDILDNLQEKLESGFYLDKINIDGKFEIWKQEEKCLVLLCCNGKIDDGGDGLAVRLPLPLRFDKEWFKNYNQQNITIEEVLFVIILMDI